MAHEQYENKFFKYTLIHIPFLMLITFFLTIIASKYSGKKS